MAEVSCAIVGGGIAGASVAYHLSEQGMDEVVVLERNAEPLMETTPKSFALFGMYGDETEYRLKQYAMELYNRLAVEHDIRYERIGHLSVATTDDVARKFERATKEEQIDVGIFATGHSRTSLEYLSGEEVHEQIFLPELETADVKGALYRPAIGYFDPLALARAMLDRAKTNGVEVRTNASVDGICTDEDGVTGVSLKQKELTADSVVLTAGPWTVDLAETAGVDLPLRHSLAPVLQLDADDVAGALPSVKHHESNYNVRGNAADDTVYLGHHQGGYADGTRMDPDEVPSSVPDDVRTGGFEILKRLMPNLADSPVVNEWVGVRSLTPDGKPIAGATSVDGLYVIAFNTSGIQLSPGLGRSVTSQLMDGPSDPLTEAISLDRFN